MQTLDAVTQSSVATLKTRQKAAISSWVKLAKAGDKAAFCEVYKACHRRLYLYCLRLCGNEQQAEEFLQESFIKAWNNLRGFRSEAGFYTWLQQIASRVFIDHYRLKESRVWQKVSHFDEFDQAHEDFSFASQTSDKEQAIDLEKMIKQLPIGARSVLVMHDLEGFTHKEISQVIGIAIGTSKAQLARARKLLKNALTGKPNINEEA